MVETLALPALERRILQFALSLLLFCKKYILYVLNHYRVFMNVMRIKKFCLSVLKGLFYSFLLIGMVGMYAIFVEAGWLKTRTVSLNQDPSVRIVHISDFHYIGNAKYLKRVVSRVNNLKPDCVCFTGDLVEDVKYLDEALTILSGIQFPLYGCPGNHDHWNSAAFKRVRNTFLATGGKWLVDSSAVLTNAGILVTSYSGGQLDTNMVTHTPAITGRTVNIYLTHYPARVPQVPINTFDIILAGHSHGGQVRLPFVGALVLPSGVDKYDRGLFHTPAGPLYVNPGIGTFFIPARLFCRPEITVIEL
jgi:predicted MPP superfamily phosphohydrolase